MAKYKLREGMIKQSITINKETWEKAGKVLADIGISRSRFIEITLRNLYKGNEQTFEKVTNDLFGDLFKESAKGLKQKKKKE